MEKVLKIRKKDAIVLGVYDDVINIQGLGKARIERVSNIEYNNDKEKWEVIMKNGGDIPIESNSRNEAYQKEVELVNQNLDDLAKKHFNI